MQRHITRRAIIIAWVFIKEQAKEPSTFFWTLLSPAALFYLLAYSRGQTPPYQSSYSELTSWFYAYISSSVAFFGFSFYIIGRRESGFTRSFIYRFEARCIFLLAQFFAYSIIALAYCLIFYGLTRPAFGPVLLSEVFIIMGRFYVCFLLFSIPGLLLTLPPLTFQNANTGYSIISFIMLVFGIYDMNTSSTEVDFHQIFNPLWLANRIIYYGLENNCMLALCTAALFVCIFLLTLRYLRVNPVWSRY